jgi:hypothetical protein
MKKILLLVFTLLVPGLLFLNAWEGYKYHVLTDEIEGLEKRQKELLERNMGVIARIAAEQSPARVEQRTVSELGLVSADQSTITRVVVGPGGDRTP